MSRKKKQAIIEIPPQALPVPIVDNHTHIHVDSEYAQSTYVGGADALADSRASAKAGDGGEGAAAHARGAGALCAGQVAEDRHAHEQALTEDGAWRLPLREKNLLSGMERAGIRAAITSACEIPDFAPVLDAVRRHPGKIFAALAIHPNEAALHAGVRAIAPDGLSPEPDPWHEELDLYSAIERVAELAAQPEVLAVGESGLDYFRTGEEGKEAQKESFRAHIALAKELDKPLQIHDRDAHADVVEILKAEGAPERTVFHCFSGDAELAQICAEHGWYASFAGPLTYHANSGLREALLALPPELILVETDAPYLTPMPFRGYPNAVWGAAYTARYQAWLRLDPSAPEMVAERTDAEVQRAAAGVNSELLSRWCEQLNANTRAVYGV